MTIPHAAEVILKVASRCNMRCSYCYMYELKEQEAWRRQPRFMSLRIASAVAREIRQHAETHKLQSVSVLLHGGEPLLAGVERLTAITNLIRDKVATSCDLIFGMQTNAVLLTEDTLRQLSECGIGIGVSLDGDITANKRRLMVNGNDSIAQTRDGLELLRRSEFRHMYGGLLAVIDVSSDPLTVYQALKAEKPAHIDFLFPLATWDDLPQLGSGEWLVRVFDAWHLDRDAPDIRLFHILMSRILGRDVRAGFIGKPPDEKSLVIQPDGSVELLDALRVIGGTEVLSTGMNITTHTIDQILTHPGFTQPEACAGCHACPLYESCGGGYYVNRWGRGRGYDNPSVYCEDLMRLITHIRTRISEYAMLPA
jgi:uncharacterized protein